MKKEYSYPGYDMWRALVPESVAVAQVNWERRQRVIRAYTMGIKISECVAIFKLSTTRIHQIINVYNDYRRERISPVERYIAQKSYIQDVADLVRSAAINSGLKPALIPWNSRDRRSKIVQ